MPSKPQTPTTPTSPAGKSSTPAPIEKPARTTLKRPMTAAPATQPATNNAPSKPSYRLSLNDKKQNPTPKKPSTTFAPRGRVATGTVAPLTAVVRNTPLPPKTPAKLGSTLGLDTMRLNKRMAEMGLCSRREADDWIEQGWVRVNGEVATIGLHVTAHDRIDVSPDAHGKQGQKVTILLHKPMGYVSGQAEDGHTPAVALLSPRTHWQGDISRQRFSHHHLKGLAPAGRLDIDSVGLLVLTQDGRIARQLIGEQSELEKEYLVRVQWGNTTTDVQSVFPEEALAQLRHGLALDGKPLKPAKVDWQNPEQLRFVLTEGKKRQIRRMCELVGLRVVGLKRIRMGRITLGQLPVGQWRYLLPDEKF